MVKEPLSSLVHCVPNLFAWFRLNEYQSIKLCASEVTNAYLQVDTTSLVLWPLLHSCLLLCWIVVKLSACGKRLGRIETCFVRFKLCAFTQCVGVLLVNMKNGVWECGVVLIVKWWSHKSFVFPAILYIHWFYFRLSRKWTRSAKGRSALRKWENSLMRPSIPGWGQVRDTDLLRMY